MTDSPLEYPCHGFHNSLAKGRSSGVLIITDAGIEFNFEGQRLRLPMSGLQLKLGGASNRLVFFAHPAHPDWSIYTSDRKILSNNILKQHPEVCEQTQRVMRASRAQRSFVVIALVMVLLLPLLALIRMDLITASIAKQIPTEWEEKISATAMAQFEMKYSFLDKSHSDALLKPLVSPLIKALGETPYQFNFYIINEASPNAFALPGGTIIIHSGLILRADSAEEILGVLAHEMTHVTEQHGLRNMIGSAGFYLIVGAFFGDASGLLAVVANTAPFLLDQSYSRDFEREADRKGHALLLRANIEPNGLASFFQKLIEEEKKQLEKVDNEQAREMIKTGFKFLSTHPGSEERIQYLNALAIPSDAQFMSFTTPYSELKQAVEHFVLSNDNKKTSKTQDTSSQPHSASATEATL